MIDVAREQDVLVVSESPSALYRGATWGWPLVAILACGAAQQTQGEASPLPWALFGVGLLGMLALLWNWRTTAHRFDRSLGKLVIASRGPVRAASQRDLSLAAVTDVIDRRSPRLRAIELTLADKSTLVVARTQARSSVLDSVARELGELLQKPVQLAPGAVIGERFVIERYVNHGGMGAVYRALDRSNGQPVALKVELGRADGSVARERFAREMQLLASVDDSRIARYVAHGSGPDGRAYLAMQWLDGEDLRARLARGPLSLHDSLQVLCGAAQAVAIAHAHGIVHRDLKPANLFLRGGSAADLVLLDFGIARRLDSATRLTGSRTLIGTPHYMAPEQASGVSDLLPAADVFTLGCIFYECLTGRHPFEAHELLGVLARILFDAPEPVEKLRPDVPAAWTKLLQRMLSKQPAERPSDGGAVAQEALQLPEASRSEGARHASVSSVAPSHGDGDQVLISVVLVTRVVDPLLGPAVARERFEQIRAGVARFPCQLERLADDSLLAAIGPRQSATDQVRIAAQCALYLREMLPGSPISVATGRAPLQRVMRVGEAVDRALQLLEPVIEPDGIRLDSLSSGLLASRFVNTPRDGVFILGTEQPDLDASRPLLGKPTPCVGRELELAQLDGLIASAAEERTPKIATVLAPPGVGKSRLRHELLRRLRDRRPETAQLVGYGDPLSAGSPYVIAGDALRRHAGIRADDAPQVARAAIVERLCGHVAADQRKRISEFLGELCNVPFPAEASPPLAAARSDHRVLSEQITAAFVDWLEAECSAAPVVFVLEDVQWADGLTLKLLEVAVRELRNAPLSVLSFGRPEAEDNIPKFFSEQQSLSIRLGSLSDKASELLIRHVLGRSWEELPVQQIVRSAAGNALFLEELIRAASEGKAGEVPETVLAMLQVRLSRLSSEARLCLRAASVFGGALLGRKAW